MRKLLLPLIVVCLTFSGGLSIASEDKEKACIGMVERAVKLFKEKGNDSALKAINSINMLTDKEVYVFAITLDNTILGHPYKPSLIGKNMHDEKDVKGKLYFHEFKAIAEGPGSEWVEYWWLRPGETKPLAKKSYIQRVPGHDIYVGAGYYPDVELTKDPGREKISSGATQLEATPLAVKR